MFKTYFDISELHTIYTLIYQAGITSQDDIDALLAFMPSQYLIQLPTDSIPASRLLKILDKVNQTEILITGDIPIRILLANAIHRLSSRIEVTKLKIYQDRINHVRTWRSLAELISQCGLVGDELEQIYQFCLCGRSLFSCANIHEMAEHLARAKHPGGGRGFAGLLFAYLIAQRSVNHNTTIDLERWIEETANTLGFQVDPNMFEQYADEFKNQSAQQEYDKNHLMVMITLETADAQKIDVSMYWKEQSQNSKKCSDAPGAIRDLSELPDEIEEVLGGRIHCTVEVFLPRELMGYNLEYPQERRSLLANHKVIRRFAERQGVNKQRRVRNNRVALKQIEAKEHWERKWQKFRGSTYDMEQHHLWIEEDHMVHENDLYLDLTENRIPGICCTSPSFAPKGQLLKLMEHNLQTGIPICFWSEYEQIDFKSTFGPCLTKSKEGFRNAIQQLQRSGLKSSASSRKGRFLYLIWDDPDNPFPGMEPGVSVRQA